MWENKKEIRIFIIPTHWDKVRNLPGFWPHIISSLKLKVLKLNLSQYKISPCFYLISWNVSSLRAWKKSHDQPRQHIKKQRHYFANKGLSTQSYGFSSSHVWMWELDYKESWAPKNWCFWTVVLEKALENPFDYKEIKPVHPKGNRS